MDLVAALSASGLVSVVGAGGKKSTMYALAERLDRAVVTATVRIPIFDAHVAAVRVTADPAGAVARASAAEWPLGLVPEREREDRYRGYEPATVEAIAATAYPQAVLVKADGARMRLLKAPAENEPRIPPATDTVLPVASAHVVGEPLTEEHVHRVERVSAITGRAVGDPLTAADVGSVLGSERGGLKGVPAAATVVPVVNMVDDDALETVGREIAAAVHATADVPRVALTSMLADEPLVVVVE